MRTGAEYINSLNDGRTVLIDGQVAGNVAEHPAFSKVVETVAELFDIAADPANGMQYQSPEIDGPANLVFGIPRSPEDLKRRRAAVERWAKHTHGWVGRSPDHVGTFFAAFAAHPEVFASEERDYAGNLTRYYERILRENLYVSYAIIPPQYSRATTASGWEGDFIQVGVVGETEEGLIVRGSQMLATGGAISAEHLGAGHPVRRLTSAPAGGRTATTTAARAHGRGERAAGRGRLWLRGRRRRPGCSWRAARTPPERP